VGHPSLLVESNTISLPLKMKTCFWVTKLAVSLKDKFQFHDLQGWRTLLAFMNLSTPSIDHMILTNSKVDNALICLWDQHMYLLKHSKIHNVYVTFKVGNTTYVFIYVDMSSPHSNI